MKPYDELAIVPYQIAQTVCGQQYTGAEISDASRSGRMVAKVETARQRMTAEQIATFASFADGLEYKQAHVIFSFQVG